MCHRNRVPSRLCLAVLGAAASVIALWACSVPVFRYAIEHWAADSYQAIVFHRGPLSEAHQSLVQELTPAGMAGRLHANVTLRLIDLDQESNPEVLAFWRQLGAEALPWLVARYPTGAGLPGNIVSATLSEPAIQKLLDSPFRKEISQRLGHGQSAVWVLLECGEPTKDESAAKLIESRLAYLATVLKLPTLDQQDIVNGLVSVAQEDLKLEFSILRLSRTDPGEQALVKMLLGTEPDLEETSEPIAFPVFGRGRALYALVGKGINHETLDEACSFLIGSCSCQVKELNPGVDLLLAADWDALMKSPQAGTARALPVSADRAASAPVTVTISGNNDNGNTASSPKASRLYSILGISIASVFGVVVLISAGILFSRKK